MDRSFLAAACAASLLLLGVDTAFAHAPLDVDTPDGALRFDTAAERIADRYTGVRGWSAQGDRLYLFLDGERVVGGDIYAATGRYQLLAGHWTRAPLTGAGVREKLAAPSARRAKADASPPVAAPGPDGNYEIDLLVVYTQELAQQWRGADALEAEIQRLIFLANGYFENSQMPIREKLVGFAPITSITDTESPQLTAMHDPAVRALRDSTAADLVVVVRHGGNACDGYSVLFNGGEQSDPPANIDPDRDGYLVLYITPFDDGTPCHGIEHLLAHEVGHALGGGHDWDPLGNGIYWKPYAHAWRCGVALPSPQVLYWTIMAGNTNLTGCTIVTSHTCLDPILTGEPKGDVFSSPTYSQDGFVCGMDGGMESLQSDNRRSMMEAAPYVAAYRGNSSAGVASESSGGGGSLALVDLLLFAALRLRRRSFAALRMTD